MTFKKPEPPKEPIILEIDLNNYPSLLDYPDESQTLLRDHLKLLNDAMNSKYHLQSKNVFKTDYVSILRDVSDAMFDYKSILAHHPNKAESEAMEILELENNPLSIFTGYSTPFDFQGNKMDPTDFLGPYKSFKTWLQGQLYASRYLPYQDYVRFMYLNEYDILESLKHQNVEKLLMIKPALSYQKENNLPIGKFIPNTGFFDCGPDHDTVDCPACGEIEEHKRPENKHHIYCISCKAGFTK